MKMFFLMVLFSTPLDRQPHHNPDFGPLSMPTMEKCLERRSFMQNYLKQQLPTGVIHHVFCVEMNAMGYDEAKDAFSRTIGTKG